MITTHKPNEPKTHTIERKELPKPICMMAAGKYGTVCAYIVTAADARGMIHEYITMPNNSCFKMVLDDHKSKEADWIVGNENEYFIHLKDFKIQLATVPHQQSYAFNLYHDFKSLEEDYINKHRDLCPKCGFGIRKTS